MVDVSSMFSSVTS